MGVSPTMQLPDIWQAIGTPQVAEITAVVSIVISIVLAHKSEQQQAKKEKEVLIYAQT
jgi:hypothetical protein